MSEKNGNEKGGALPGLTSEQRAEFARRGLEARQRRAQWRAGLPQAHLGGQSVADAIDEAKADPVLARMRVEAFVRSYPGVGRKRAAKMLEAVGVAEGRRIRGLGSRQSRELAEMIEETVRRWEAR